MLFSHILEELAPSDNFQQIKNHCIKCEQMICAELANGHYTSAISRNFRSWRQPVVCCINKWLVYYLNQDESVNVWKETSFFRGDVVLSIHLSRYLFSTHTESSIFPKTSLLHVHVCCDQSVAITTVLPSGRNTMIMSASEYDQICPEMIILW